MIIDYLGHSGFLVETGSALLLFDYFRGDLSSVLSSKPAGKPLFVFASHAHADHFNPKIFSVSGRPAEYLLSFDLLNSPDVPDGLNVRFLDADAEYSIEGLGTVQTLLSTDEGVAFLVETPEGTLFHAGDLHWWDWPGEDPDWLKDQETVFAREIGRIAGKRIDAAFCVLDDRLEKNYAKGLSLFLSVCSPKAVFPMHFWHDRTVVERFKMLPAAVESGAVIYDTANENHWELQERRQSPCSSK